MAYVKTLEMIGAPVNILQFLNVKQFLIVKILVELSRNICSASEVRFSRNCTSRENFRETAHQAAHPSWNNLIERTMRIWKNIAIMYMRACVCYQGISFADRDDFTKALISWK